MASLIEAVLSVKKPILKEKKMKNLKKNEDQEIEAETKFYDLMEKAEGGDINSIMRILANSNRDYDVSEDELNDLLNF